MMITAAIYTPIFRMMDQIMIDMKNQLDDMMLEITVKQEWATVAVQNNAVFPRTFHTRLPALPHLHTTRYTTLVELQDDIRNTEERERQMEGGLLELITQMVAAGGMSPA